MERIPFGVLPDGSLAELCEISSPYARVMISTLGANVVRVLLPDRSGHWEDVVLGFDTPEEYLTKPGNLGATIGRYAGRIAGGQFHLHGELIQLRQNRGRHTIHGGPVGFHQKLWTVLEHREDRVVLELISPDGDQGFPGTLAVQAEFRLEKDSLTLETRAVSDQDTVCSLTNHTYWNLAGHQSGTIDEQVLTVWSDTYLETDEETIPTGAIRSLEGTNLDLRHPTRLKSVEADHTFLLGENSAARLVGRLEDPKSGRWMELFTDLPGVQIYTGDHLRENFAGKDGASYGPRSGVCMEAQFYPDSPNHAHFPSTLLKEGAVAKHWMCWHFGVC